MSTNWEWCEMRLFAVNLIEWWIAQDTWEDGGRLPQKFLQLSRVLVIKDTQQRGWSMGRGSFGRDSGWLKASLFDDKDEYA